MISSSVTSSWFSCFWVSLKLISAKMFSPSSLSVWFTLLLTTLECIFSDPVCPVANSKTCAALELHSVFYWRMWWGYFFAHLFSRSRSRWQQFETMHSCFSVCERAKVLVDHHQQPDSIKHLQVMQKFCSTQGVVRDCIKDTREERREGRYFTSNNFDCPQRLMRWD